MQYVPESCCNGGVVEDTCGHSDMQACALRRVASSGEQKDMKAGLLFV